MCRSKQFVKLLLLDKALEVLQSSDGAFQCGSKTCDVGECPGTDKDAQLVLFEYNNVEKI